MHVPPSLRRPVDAVRRWPVDSQLVARRNAMIASTALARQRAEREEVEELLGAGREAPVPEAADHAANG
jgi:hypothetical protein